MDAKHTMHPEHALRAPGTSGATGSEQTPTQRAPARAYHALLPSAPTGHEVWTRELCAAHYGVSLMTWGKWERAGRVPAQRYRTGRGLGPRVCYLVQDVVALPGLAMNPYPRAPEGAEIMLREACAAFFGVREDTLSSWESDGRWPLTRYRAPHGLCGRIAYLRAEVEAHKERVRTAYEPVLHPDQAAYPGAYALPLVTGKGRVLAVIDAGTAALIRGELWNISERQEDGQTRGVVVLARDTSVLLKRVVTGTQKLSDARPVRRTQPGERSGRGGRGGRGVRGVRVSHRNGDHLDCRASNLLVRSYAQQSYAMSKMTERNGRPTTSAYKGVSWMESKGRWTAHIGKNGRAYYLGLFEDEAAAAREYDNAVRWLFGEHGLLNFPMERPLLRLPRAGALSKPGAMARAAAA